MGPWGSEARSPHPESRNEEKFSKIFLPITRKLLYIFKYFLIFRLQHLSAPQISKFHYLKGIAQFSIYEQEVQKFFIFAHEAPNSTRTKLRINPFL